MRYPLVIIGAGLSGLAAGIRFARFGQKVLILEKHHTPGGLNSYYQRQGRLIETGLHAMTNFALPGDKRAPLNRLCRQLKISRDEFDLHEQRGSLVVFPGDTKLHFSNDIELLKSEVARCFPAAVDNFRRLIELVDGYDPFERRPFISAVATLSDILNNDTLRNMLLFPLMMYGSSNEHDMDLAQFVIMFRAVYQEGFCRPASTMKEFLALLLDKYRGYGGEVLFNRGVSEVICENGRVQGVRTEKGEEFHCDYLVSTAGYPETLRLTGAPVSEQEPYVGRMSFVETVYFLDEAARSRFADQPTITFFNLNEAFDYCRPATPLDPMAGVICFPDHFVGLKSEDGNMQLRVTNPANHKLWQTADRAGYMRLKEEWGARSRRMSGKIIGNYETNIVYQDTFTPLTIERFTAKAAGAIYGSPVKIKDGRTAYDNLIVAGTDQGFLGIIGSMLSGVSMVNEHVLGKV